MKKYLSFAILLPCLLFLGCEKSQTERLSGENTDQGPVLKSTESIPLVTKQNEVIGSVNITFNTPGEITVEYFVNEADWCMIETHLDVQTDPAKFPMTSKGNPIVGQFMFGEMLDCEMDWDVTIDLNLIDEWEAGDILFIAAEANALDPDGEEQKLWAQGEPFPGKSWGMYFSVEPPFICGDLIFDAEGNSYQTVQIGTQCWMAENLNVGTMILSSATPSQENPAEKYCYDDDEDNCEIYGGLYLWDELMNYTNAEGGQGICPDGWHIATDEEWKILEGFADSQYGVGDPVWEQTGWRGYDAGFHLKSTTGWVFVGSGNDTYGFNAKAHGYFLPANQYFGHFQEQSYYWTSTEENTSMSWVHTLAGSEDNASRYYNGKDHAFSVRCIKD